jgi:hypothetical protein
LEPLSSPLPSPTCHHPPHDTAACPGPSRETLRHESHRRQGHRGGGRRGRQARQTLGGSRAVTWLARYKRRGRVDRPPPGSDPCRRRERRVDPSFTELAPTALGARVNAGAPEPVQVEPQRITTGHRWRRGRRTRTTRGGAAQGPTQSEDAGDGAWDRELAPWRGRAQHNWNSVVCPGAPWGRGCGGFGLGVGKHLVVRVGGDENLLIVTGQGVRNSD